MFILQHTNFLKVIAKYINEYKLFCIWIVHISTKYNVNQYLILWLSLGINLLERWTLDCNDIWISTKISVQLRCVEESWVNLYF